MNRQQRTRTQRLEAILERHDEYIQRTLADLRVAGFKFTTIDAAYRRRSAVRRLAALTAEAREEALIHAIEREDRA